jgi:hypothetical protein
MQTYLAAVAAEAAGVSASDLQRYANQGHLTFQPCDGESRGSGDKRQYSTRRVIQTAIISECRRLGISPSRAGRAAFEFSDRGSPGRAVGEIYPLGRTVLMGLADGQSKVINIPPDLTIADVLTNDGAAWIIDCGNVVAKVTEKLSQLC